MVEHIIDIDNKFQFHNNISFVIVDPHESWRRLSHCWAGVADVGRKGHRVIVHEAWGQHLGHQRPVAGLADEEDKHDYSEAPVDDLENIQDRVKWFVGMDPIHEKRSTLQIGMTWWLSSQ